MAHRVETSSPRDWLLVLNEPARPDELVSAPPAGVVSEANVGSVFDAMPSALMVVGGDGLIKLTNACHERMFGYSRADLVGTRMINLELAAAASALGVTQGASQIVEMMGRHRRGEMIPIEVTSIPLAAGGTLYVINDISGRRRAEAALKTKSEELERSNADLEQFAYVASHDLQEPLRMVASYTQLLAEKYQGNLDETADRYINYAVDGAKRMQGLVQDLLSYSRVTATAKPLVEVDVNALVADILRVMDATLAAAGGVVSVGALPNVIADAAQLRHVFLNGLANAVKFRREEPPRILVRGAMSGGMASFAIEDNGIGLDPRHAARIFQMFQRLHERGKYEGSGIGLAIVKKIVERHNGRVWMESELGAGARLCFTLPAAAS